MLSCFSPVGEGDVEDQEYQQLLTEHQLLLLEEEELLAIGRSTNAETISLKVHLKLLLDVPRQSVRMFPVRVAPNVNSNGLFTLHGTGTGTGNGTGSNGY